MSPSSEPAGGNIFLMVFDAYLRNTARGADALKRAGHPAVDEDWAGGFRGIAVPLETGHRLEIAAPLPGEWDHWSARVVRHPDDPGYEQEGLRLGKPQGQRISSSGTSARTWKVPQDDTHDSVFSAHPRELPAKVNEFLSHPQVRKAISDDVAKQRTERAVRGGHPPLGPQFGG